MKYLLMTLAVLVGSTCFAQNDEYLVPDYKRIEKAVSKKSSDFYYPRLMERYLAGDTTLGIEEKHHLYYGFVFDDRYAPYASSDHKAALNEVLEKDSLDRIDYLRIEELTDSALIENPFDFRSLNYQLYALDKLGTDEKFNVRLMQYITISDALMASGDGKSIETAFYVTHVSHEYDLLRIIGLRFGGSQSLKGQVDYLTLEENAYGLEGLYFDVGACLQSLKRMLELD